jgi:hypothetical protein
VIVTSAMTKKSMLGIILKMESTIQTGVDSGAPSMVLVVGGSIDEEDSEMDWVIEESVSAILVTCCEAILPPRVYRNDDR